MDRKVRTSKFIREYGKTIHELSAELNLSRTYIWTLHRAGELHQFIEEQEKKKEVATR